MSLNKVNYVDGQTIISAQNMNDIQDEVIRLGEKEIVQSDWLEQDENSSAYVKNKPFGLAGQYAIKCTAESAATSDKLIEVIINCPWNSSNQDSNIYYLYNVTPNGWFISNAILQHKLAFEESSGFYSTIYDRQICGGNRRDLASYGFANQNITGTIQFSSDVDSAPTFGIIEIESSTDSNITVGVYICLNARKETNIKKVLWNQSYIWLRPGALSTIDMPLSVNYALMSLSGLYGTPLKPIIESAEESLNNLSEALDNKVDKVGNKVLSDVNFTKDYESKVKNISNLENRISNLEYYHSPDYTDQEVMVQSAIMIANEIAANPRGAYLNTQELLTEYAKLMSGQTSDKVFAIYGSEVFFTKMSDKTPAKEDFKKGFSTVLAYPDEIYGFMALKPQIGLMIPDIAFDPSLWEDLEADSAFTDLDEAGSFIFSDVFLIAQEGNSMGLPKGLYVPTSFDMLVLGLQINGFDLSSSTAPVSRAQIEDILLFIEESMVTFTVNGVSHRAIKGMTWGEWINSRYNDTELTTVAHWQVGQVIGVNSTYLLRPYVYVYPKDVIQAEEYRLGQETAEPM